MNKPLTPGFAEKVSLVQVDFNNEVDIQSHAFQYQSDRRLYFRSQGWKLAEYALDLLLEKTKGKMRDDGVTPEWVHSARPTEMIDSLLRSGLIDRAKVERQYGSLQILAVDQLLHDLGENEGVRTAMLRDYFMERIKFDTDTKYTLQLRQRDIQDLTPICRDFLLLTHGKNGEKSFNSYLLDLLTSGYAFLTKLGDRNDNLATLIGLKRPAWDDAANSPDAIAQTNTYFNRIRRYYSHTAQTFSTHDLVGQACEYHPLLANAYDALDGAMDVLFRLNRAYVGYHPYHPENADNKSKRLDARMLVIDISSSFERAKLAYQHTHPGTNPIEILMGRIKEEAHAVPELHFQLQTQPRNRGLRKPSPFDQVMRMFLPDPGNTPSML